MHETAARARFNIKIVKKLMVSSHFLKMSEVDTEVDKARA